MVRKSHIDKTSTIRYGVYISPFGPCFVAMRGTDICRISFIEKGEEKAELQLLEQQWSAEEVIRDDVKIGILAKKLFEQGSLSGDVVVRGTNFQTKVWKALLAIPEGEVITYREIAQKIGSPHAVRAVGTACGKNPIAFVIPCHRVIASDGGLGGYRWGLERKKLLLAWEARQA